MEAYQLTKLQTQIAVKAAAGKAVMDVIGISPKQLSKVIRLQAALKLLINREESLTHIAYEGNYYDQSHFIKDFKEFTGVRPSDFWRKSMMLSSLLYK